MSLGSYNTVTVGTSPTLIVAANPERKGVLVVNNGTAALYIGPDANIATSNAIPILPQDSNNQIGLDSAYRGAIYGVVAASSLDCRYWEWNY